MANPNLFKKAGRTIGGNLTVTGDLQVLGNINKGLQQAAVNASTAAGLLNRLTGQFAPPGTIWNTVAAPFSNGNTNFAFGDNIFFGLDGVTGKLLESITNGLTWTNPSSPLSVSGTGIAFGSGSWGNAWILAGDTNKIYRSTNDGTSWSSITNPFATGGKTINCLAFGNGIFIAGDTAGDVSYSTDGGQTWSALYALPSASIVRQFAFGNNVWVAVGTGNPPKVWRSVDNGQTFTSVTSPFSGNLIPGVAFGQGFFLAEAGASGVTPQAEKSSDGSSWSSITIPLTSSDVSAPVVGWGQNTFVIGGYGGGSGQRAAISTDIGATWTLIPGGNFNCLTLGFGNQTFVANTYNVYTGTVSMMYSTWLSYGKGYLYVPSFQGFGTPTAVSFSWQRKPGSNTISVWGNFTSGTNTAVEVRLGLPVGLVSDSSLIPSIMLRGIGAWAGGNFQTIAMLIEPGVGYMTLGVYNSGIGVLGKLAGNQLPSTTVFSCYFEIPISGWN